MTELTLQGDAGDAFALDYDGGGAMAVVAQGKDCEELDPYSIGLPEEVAAKIVQVLKGSQCNAAELIPEMPADCDVDAITEADSKIRFDGIMILMEDGSYTLQKGQAVYDAIKGACGKFPSAKLSAIGIEIIPSDTSDESKVQGRLEDDPNNPGELLLRIYVWRGDAEVQSGDIRISLHEGQQALISKGMKSIKAYGAKEAKSDKAKAPMLDLTGSDAQGFTQAETRVAKGDEEGCRHVGTPLDTGSFALLMTLLATMAKTRKKANSALSK